MVIWDHLFVFLQNDTSLLSVKTSLVMSTEICVIISKSGYAISMVTGYLWSEIDTCKFYHALAHSRFTGVTCNTLSRIACRIAKS